MNIAGYSPALTLLFVWALLWILLNLKWSNLSQTQKRVLPLLLIALAVITQTIRIYFGSTVSAKLIFFTMHLPTFFAFRKITNLSTVKMIFMILTALVFTAPTVLIGNIVQNIFAPNFVSALLIANLISYGFILLLAHLVLKKGFYYLLRYGDDNLFLIISIIPLLYYLYVFAIANLEIGTPGSINDYFIRHIPTMEVFVFYFLLPYICKYLVEKQVLEASQAALHQALSAAEEQIALASSTQTQMEIYQHDMRHHFMTLEQLLNDKKIQEAQHYLEKIYRDIEAITLKQFCKNEIVNLMCSAFFEKAQKANIQLNITAKLPQKLPIPDPDLGAILSNGLENALNAVAELEPPFRYVNFYCEVKQNKLLIEITNPYLKEFILEDDIPISNIPGHGYGCQSIHSIAERHHGHCFFQTEQNLFILRVLLPIKSV